MNNTQWMPFVTIHDQNINKVANLSIYVIPQFFTYEKFADGTWAETFYDAIPCSPIFENISDRALEEELIPLWPGTQWWCPDVKEITL